MKTISTIAATILITGCASTHDFVKDVEGKAYDRLADAVSKYCKGKIEGGVLQDIVLQEALELRREIRQRGSNGPQGPAEPVLYLDDKTAYAQGPMIRIWCEGESVPRDIWPDFVRVRK